MKKKTLFVSLILVLIVLVTSGCLDFFKTTENVTTYVSHPTKAQYVISYGYTITCRGVGEYNIEYDCDIPEVLIGQVTITEHDNTFDDITLANNLMKSWNISGSDDNNYQLGITATVIAESFIVADLNGADALSIQEIKDQYWDVFRNYCNAQSNETITFIDPENEDIRSTAQTILYQADSDNSFIIAKNLFIWLKENTYYKTHEGSGNVQPASVTKQCGHGDCDDLSFLYISLCRSIDIPARFIRGFIVEEDVNGFVDAVSHAWVEVFVGGNIGNNGWIPVECAGSSDSMEVQVNQNFGVESVGHLRLFEDDGSDESLIISLSDIKAKYDTNIIVKLTPVAEVYSYQVLESKELLIDNNNRKYK